jgi:DNA-binding NtrC family response regulator
VDVRILATTNRDMAAEVAAGRFRADLFFRLNVVGLRLPPLRERPGDVAALAAHFARRYAELNGFPPRPLAPDALRRLAAHSWPGNVRELENAVHRAVLLADGDSIEAEAIELDDEGPEPPRFASAHGDPAAALVGRTVGDVERDLILHTLRHTMGNRTHAAALLGISIRALRNKLRDYIAAGSRVPPPASGLASPIDELLPA